jgi:hypothetical protein
MNHAALLEQLKIDRGAAPRARTGALRFFGAAA